MDFQLLFQVLQHPLTDDVYAVASAETEALAKSDTPTRRDADTFFPPGARGSVRLVSLGEPIFDLSLKCFPAICSVWYDHYQ